MPSEMMQLKQLEEENGKLKRPMADLKQTVMSGATDAGATAAV